MLESSLPETGPVSTYPVTLYLGPISNVGQNPNQMKYTDLRYLYECVQGGKWEQLVAAVHALAAHKNEKGPDGKPTEKAKAYTAAKHRLPFSVVSGHYTPRHRHSPDPHRPNPEKPNHYDRFPECAVGGAYPPIPSGIRFMEMDNLDEGALALARAVLQAHPSVIACWKSPGGNGLHIFVLVDPKPITDAHAHDAYEAVAAELGITDTGDASVKNLARLAFVSHDPDAYWNPDAPAPIAWEISEIPEKGQSEPENGKSETANKARTAPETNSGAKSPTEGRGTRPGVPERGHDADGESVANALFAMVAGKAGLDDNHMLAVMGNLKALGKSFEEFDQWADAAGCTCERRGRWDNPPSGSQSDRPGWAIVNLAVKHYSFTFKKAKTKAKSTAKANGQIGVLPPKPSWDGVVPDYWAAWLAYTAHNALVVVRDLNAGAKDGKICYSLYAVDEDTGRLDCGELMTRYRVEAAERYLAACLGLDGKEFANCCKHAREMRIANNARTIAENVGGSVSKYPDVWASIPFHTPLDLNADLSVIGMPSGVWSIPERRFLTPEEARPKLCTATIRWDYDADAHHPEAIALFQYMYGDLVDTTTMKFARWRQAGTALARRPRQEIMVKVSPSGSAKTTEGNLQQNAFHPLVISGVRAAIEQPNAYNTGGSSHNSYLSDFARPARRINVPEVSDDKQKRPKPLNSQLLRDLSESATITYRDPGPYQAVRVPYSAHLFMDGNLPKQGQDLLQISDPDSDSAKAVKRRLRGSPFTQIPETQQRGELYDYGNPANANTPEEADDIAAFNATIVRLMCDGMAQHWDLLMKTLPMDGHSQALIDELQNLGKPTWQVKWLPLVLKAAGPDDEITNTLAIYQAYLDWHDENDEGKPASRRAVSEAVKQRYGLQLGEQDHGYLNGKRATTNACPGWKLEEPKWI